MNADNLKKEIKRIRIGHVALLLAGIFVAFSVLGGTLLLAGGWRFGNLINNSGSISFGPGQTYDVNDRQELDLEGVEAISIVAVSDDPVLVAGGKKVVAELKGRCRSTGGPVSLDARKAGSTLIIEVKYPITSSVIDTTLTITIPESFAGDLQVSTTSGDVTGMGLPFRLGNVDLHTVSGDIDFNVAGWSRLVAGTVSGRVRLTGVASDTTVKTTSGDVSLEYAAFAKTTVSTVSGGVKAAIPDGDGFIVDFSSTSGDFMSSHPALKISGADGGFYGAANGGNAALKVNTTSGDLDVYGK